MELVEENKLLKEALNLTAFDWLEQKEAGSVCDECDQEIADTMEEAAKSHLPSCYVGKVRKLASQDDPVLLVPGSKSPETVRECVNIVKHLASHKVPPYDMPADSFIEDAVRKIIQVLRTKA
jgi:hypothetical protein